MVNVTGMAPGRTDADRLEQDQDDEQIHVVLATDAMTDGDADAHHNSVERIFPDLGETTTTDEVLDLLEKSR